MRPSQYGSVKGRTRLGRMCHRPVLLRSSRHPDLTGRGFGASKWVEDADSCYDVEADERYQRIDMAAVHAYEARRAFIDSICHGAARADLATAALAISAEDDALVTHSTVPFPIAAYRQRITKLAQQCATRVTPALPQGSSPADVVSAVTHFLQHEQGFHVPADARSALPANAVVDHAGVWEDSRDAYLHELLIRKRGSGATVCVLLYEVLRHLLVTGDIDFAVRINCRDFDEFPVAEALPMPRAALALPDGGVLNTCTTDALVDMLRHLKRAFWPFAWDTGFDPPRGQGVGSQGGFRSAAQEAIEGPVNSQIQAIARAAAHRLTRGVWTSPGAGDIRRALAAAERLVLLCGEDAPWERRDLAVLYMFRGMPERAKAELLAYSESAHARQADAEDRKYVAALLRVLQDVRVEAGDEPISVEWYLGQRKPDLDDGRRLPLTW